MKKNRLDLIVVERGIFDTRQTAQTAIMDGAVLVNGEKVTKPGQNINVDAKIELTKSFEQSRYVSRGGFKLEKALNEFGIDVARMICLDIGASTGGFTDCLLQRGARKVYAIDVGYGQIDWKLRQDSRVVVMERVNARYLEAEQLYSDTDEWAGFFVADVSFISLVKIFPALSKFLGRPATGVCLVKPQFEVGRELVEKGGVVRSPAAHALAIRGVAEFAACWGLVAKALTFSPITGPAGNIEYLLQLGTDVEAEALPVEEVVEAAHLSLKK